MVEVQKTLDVWFTKVQKEVSVKISYFVAFFFFIIAFGAFLGIMIMQHYPGQAMMAVLLPALAGAIAYYNRAFATGIFALLILIVFVL
ncbi:MAG: hypothetical protein WCW44_03195 [archaeon]|jgi:hypothetical protein